jgi:hypothetical protein
MLRYTYTVYIAVKTRLMTEIEKNKQTKETATNAK